MNRPVVVVGSVNLDRVQTVATLPAPGATVHGTSFATFHGGKGANQAVAAARMGAPVHFLGAVGDDAEGARLRAALVADGIDVAGLRTLDGPTGFATILVADDGENVIVLEAGANGRLLPDHLDPSAFVGAAVALFQLEVPLATVRRGLELARAAGATTVLNAAPPVGADALPAELVDVLVVNATEAAALASSADALMRSADALASGADARDPAALLDALAARYATVVLTLGADGVAWARGAERGRRAARRVPVVDTTGAGDTFTGALVAGMAAGVPWGEALERATIAASLCVGVAGAQASIPRAADVDRVRGAG
ncbi:MAG: ribokinase [Trueperaceae bacterium]|nr:ribokinase [Trueperaceae bacterium]